MDRVILLTLLAFPVLVIVHVALSLHQADLGMPGFWAASSGIEQERPYVQAHWQPLERAMPSRFMNTVRAQGS